MRTTNFAKYLSEFLTVYMVNERGFSHNTIKSYRDTFVQFISYISEHKNIKIDRLDFSIITQNMVIEFLDWLEKERKCSIQTRNNRLAAIHSFIKYVQYQCPDNLFEFQRILSIRNKKHTKGKINYLTIEGISLLLSMPNKHSINGRRDLALLSLMYDIGARVQEMADLKVEDVHLDRPFYINVCGKGNKIRTVPMTESQLKVLSVYMKENGLTEKTWRPYPLFMNNRKEKLTRGGITYILKKYVTMARKVNPDIIPEIVSCHSLRHSKAMHLLQAGVNLVYIRDILGHVSIQITEVYARADSKQKREAIRKAYQNVIPEIEPLWEKDKNLLQWLKSF